MGEDEKVEQQIKSRVREIAQRRKNVTLADIEWICKKLEGHHKVKFRKAKHGILVSLDCQRFMVNSHNPGSKQVKTYSVDDFLDAMIDLGWYED